MTLRVAWKIIGSTAAAIVVTTCSAAPVKTASTDHDVNILVNAGFELGTRFNGTPMRQHPHPDEATLALGGRKDGWTPVDAEGWLVEGADAGGVAVAAQAHTGKRGLVVAPTEGARRVVISSFNRTVPSGPVTLSAWIRTRGAKATLDLDLVTGWQQVMRRGATVRRSFDLPPDSDWTRVSVTAESPSALAALCRLSVTAGTVWMDDVQIAAGGAPIPFGLRPQEWLRLSFAGSDDANLAAWRAGDPAPRRVVVHNDSPLPLSGTATVYAGPWDRPKARTLATFPLSELKTGGVKAVPLSIAGLLPNAYVVTLSVTRGGATVVDGAREFFPNAPSGGAASNGMLASRSAIRFALAPKTPPGSLFGVGNGMLDSGGSWYQGFHIEDYLAGRALGLTGARGRYGDDVGYLAAAGATPFHVTGLTDRLPMGAVDSLATGEDASIANPANPRFIDIYNPRGLAFFTARARRIGSRFAADLMVATFQMANEKPYLNGGGLCPSPDADADFRAWCRRTHGDLATLNRRWNSRYADWGEVEQIVSARFVEEAKNAPKKEGAAAIDWTASTGQLPPAVVARMATDPGRAMDWMRWRTESSLRIYSTFRAEARKADRKTLYSANLCWPAFWPQMFMPFARAMDVTMLDIQYTSGMKRALGSPMEMMDGMEMAESTSPQKPIWGIETYIQPQWQGNYLALQNWGLLAHGMTNNLVFGWKPYADAGPIREARAWEKPDAPPMWFIIDKDGTKLPHYDSNRRSLEEIRAYHRRFDGFSVKRAPTDTAFFVSTDTAELVVMETGNRPWDSLWQRTRNNLIYLLRLNGIAVDYVDDTTLPDAPGRFRKIVVPAACVLRQESAERLSRFARAGGTVILAGPTGLRDPWMNPYETVGGPAWADLNWKASVPSPKDTATIVFGGVGGEPKNFRGGGGDGPSGAKPLVDDAGTTIGWTRAWGKGRLVAYAVCPDVSSKDPHIPAELSGWLRQLIAAGGLKYAARWVDAIPVKPSSEPSAGNEPGTGAPVVEVVVRERGANEKFVFCLNQGGTGEGTVEVSVTGAGWRCEDVLTGKPVAGADKNGTWRLPLRLESFGYRVLRLVRAK